MTSGCAEQTDVTAGRSPAARCRGRSSRMFSFMRAPARCCPSRNVSSSACVEVPSIGPRRRTARAPAALANRSASRGARPRSQRVTKVAPKASPAPVGSTSSTAKPPSCTTPPASWQAAPSAPFLTTIVRTPRARRSRTAVASSLVSENRNSSSPLGRNTSVRASTWSSASRRPGAVSISLRRLGSNDTVPPCDRTRCNAVRTSSARFGDDSAEPMTCRCPAPSIIAIAAAEGAIAPLALWRML